MCTVEPRFNDLRYNDIPGITSNICLPSNSYSKMYGAEPWYNNLCYNNIKHNNIWKSEIRTLTPPPSAADQSWRKRNMDTDQSCTAVCTEIHEPIIHTVQIDKVNFYIFFLFATKKRSGKYRFMSSKITLRTGIFTG